MGYILGTAGHVDHGKTTLVEALTGVYTSHLPEEKKRGMTIELGFASFCEERVGTVGIVDVPGHERFIRNMVQGAWGLDAALFVVAADDGWMNMSLNHLRILKAMWIKNILVVITKKDLVDAPTLELVKDDIARHCVGVLGYEVPVVAVSSITKDGMDELKEAIVKLLLKCKLNNSEKPFLYIDRVFTLRGIGLTVTGTLRNGKISVGDALTLYPGNVDARVKSIQNHHKNVENLIAPARTALNLKLPDKVEVSKGMLLSNNQDEPILEGNELLIRIDEVFGADKGENVKNHGELEIALGSTHAIGSLHINSYDTSLARLSLKSAIACAWNQRAVLIRHGGSDIIASCRVLASFATYNRIAFREAFTAYNGRELSSWQSYLFNLYGYATQGLDVSKEGDVITLSGFHFAPAKFINWKNKIINIAKSRNAGFTAEEIELNPLPLKAKVAILNHLCDEGVLSLGGRIYIEKGKGKESLNPLAKTIVQAAKDAGDKGVDVSKLNVPQCKTQVRDLVKMGLLICIEDYLYYHKDVFDEVVKKILEGYKQGDRISIADAKDATGLSRKYIIPILNIIEKMKILKRDGNDRIVL